MLFITNANGDALNFIPSQVYQGSNEASEIIFLSPITAGVVECTFTLPDGTRTTPVILRALVEQGTFDVVKDGVTFQFRMWRAVLPRSVTQVAGAVQAKFTISNGTQSIATASFSFNVVFGAGQIRPDPPAQDVYEAIVEALGEADTRLDAIEVLTGTLRTDLSNETTARQDADTAINDRLTSAEEGLAAEAAARESADTALGNRIDAVEVDIDGKVDKVQAGSNYKVYGVKPANSGGAQTSIDATEFATKGNTIVMRDQNGIFYVKDPVYDSQPVNLRTQTSAINAAKAEVKDYVDEKVSQFDIIAIVSELPATGEPNRLYLVTKTGGTSGDLFDEYVWENGAWERVGSASIDLSGYATTAELTEGLAGKLDKNEGWSNQYSAYGVDTSGNQIMYIVSSSAINDSIALRGATGTLAVGTPTEDNHATTKQYVDEGLDGKAAKINNTTGGGRIVGVKDNGDYVLYVPNNTSAEPNSIARRGAGGTLIVGTPTANNHATTKQYVDGKCVTVNCDLSTLSWTKAGQVGPDATKDIAWITPYSALGIKSGAKAVIWVLTNAGYPYKTGSCVFGTYPTTEESGGLIQFTNDGNLTVIGANSPSMSVAPNALFVVFY